MSYVSNVFFSRIIGNKVSSVSGKTIGRLSDLIASSVSVRPEIIAAQIKTHDGMKIISMSNLQFDKVKGQYVITCANTEEFNLDEEKVIYLGKYVFDRQIVDMNGRKLVRVNDLKLAIVNGGVHLIAVDVGLEGFLRRLGLAKPLSILLKPFKISLSNHLILWDDVETVDFGHKGIKLSKDNSNLFKLHASDLADIIEDMDKMTQIAVFASLDDEKAADVLEELEPEAQVSLLENMSIEKAADLLELMPSDEAADILDEMREETAEELLSSMESEASDEIRELMEYPEDEVGSIMTTDFICFPQSHTVDETIVELRKLKPESDTIYNIYIVNDEGQLVSTVSLRDLIVSEPDVQLQQIVSSTVISINDHESIDALSELISKYNLLAVPVVDDGNVLAGIVIINDVIYHLLRAKRKRV